MMKKKYISCIEKWKKRGSAKKTENQVVETILKENGLLHASNTAKTFKYNYLDT